MACSKPRALAWWTAGKRQMESHSKAAVLCTCSWMKASMNTVGLSPWVNMHRIVLWIWKREDAICSFLFSLSFSLCGYLWHQMGGLIMKIKQTNKQKIRMGGMCFANKRGKLRHLGDVLFHRCPLNVFCDQWTLCKIRVGCCTLEKRETSHLPSSPPLLLACNLPVNFGKSQDTALRVVSSV